jgi:hypothetical protein
MMQFTKPRFYRSQFFKKLVIKLLLLSLLLLSAGQQVSLVGGGSYDPDAITSASELFAHGELDYSGVLPVTDILSIGGDFSTLIYPAVEYKGNLYHENKMFPYVVDGGMSALLDGEIQSGQILFEGDLTPKAKTILLDSGEPVKRLGGYGLGGGYDLSLENFEVGATLLYRYGSFEDNSDIDITYDEANLYYGGYINGLLKNRQFYGGVNHLAKNDLNNYNGYNWSRSAIIVGTKLVLNKRKTQIYSRLSLTNLQGDEIVSNGYSTGIGADVYLRFVQRLSRKLWLKSEGEIIGREDALKGRFGGSLRKVGKFVSVEGGYWSSVGSLFPRQCLWATNTIWFAKKHLELQPSFKNYWIVSDNSYRYYRTDILLALNVLPKPDSRKISFSGGGLWKNFRDAPKFGSGIEFYLGMESIL